MVLRLLISSSQDKGYQDSASELFQMINSWVCGTGTREDPIPRVARLLSSSNRPMAGSGRGL